MPTSLDDLPRDNDGVVTGLFRIIHAVDSYTEGFGNGIVFTDGVAGPVGGQALAKLVAAMGQDLTVEPWDSEPAQMAEPAPEPAPAPAPAPAAVVPAPVVEDDQEASQEASVGERENLLALAEEMGIKVDGRWGTGRLEAEIEAVMSAYEDEDGPDDSSVEQGED